MKFQFGYKKRLPEAEAEATMVEYTHCQDRMEVLPAAGRALRLRPRPVLFSGTRTAISRGSASSLTLYLKTRVRTRRSWLTKSQSSCCTSAQWRPPSMRAAQQPYRQLPPAMMLPTSRRS